MASTITHAFFMEDIYDSFDIDTRLFLRNHKENLKTFAQSMDTLNFYFKKKSVRDFAHTFHTEKTGEFLITLINYIKYNYYSNNPEVMSFLYGILSHYILDSTIHPYIHYKTGEYNNFNKETYKYNGKHHEMETAIDKYLIEEKKHIKSSKFRHYEYCFNVSYLSENLKDVINFCFKETYNIKQMDQIYIDSINSMRKTFKILRYDPLGIKLFFYRIFDFISTNKVLNGKFLSYHYLNKKIDYLNNDHNEWHNPVDNKRYVSSFNDLYDRAIKKYMDIIKDVNGYIYNDKKIYINKTIKNLSYITGLDLNKKQELKYFEF